MIDEEDKPAKRRKSSKGLVPISEVPPGDIPTEAEMFDEVGEDIHRKRELNEVAARATLEVPEVDERRNKVVARRRRMAEEDEEEDPIVSFPEGEGLLPIDYRPVESAGDSELTMDEYHAKYGELPPYPESGDEL